jgi:hypothetical protein
VADLHAALARGDKRLVSVMSLGESVPGAEDRPDAIKRFGTKLVYGTSDAAPSDLQANALDYAETYNRLLLRRLKASGEISKVPPPPVIVPVTSMPTRTQ